MIFGVIYSCFVSASVHHQLNKLQRASPRSTQKRQERRNSDWREDEEASKVEALSVKEMEEYLSCLTAWRACISGSPRDGSHVCECENWVPENPHLDF